MSTSVWCARCHACDSGRYAGTATRGVLCHHPRVGSRVRTACGTSYCSPPPRLVCDLPHGCFASAPQTAWQHTCTCCLVPPCATVYRASYRALCRLETPCSWLCTAVQGAPIRRIRPRQSNRPHGSEAHSANEPPQAGIGRASAWACCARRKESPNPSYSGWSPRAQELHARDSRHRAASAGLFAPAGELASRGTLRAMRMGCVCSARLQLLPETWNSVA